MRNIIFDTDPGHDDIMAIMMALAHPEEFNILGYTTCCGNQTVEKVTRNLCSVLTMIGKDGKVAKGAERPMYLEPEPQPAAHGESGLDGPVLAEPTVLPVDKDAVEFLHDMISSVDKVTIVALAPLTNIALFIKKYPELIYKIEKITMMGGSRAGGNVIRHAEFNLYHDPHAARIVFESGIPIVLSDLEVCLECRTPHEITDSLTGIGPIHELAYDIMYFFSQYRRQLKEPGAPLFDLVPVMHMLHPELFEELPCNIYIETEGAETRGMSVVTPDEKGRMILLDHCLDVAKFNEYLLEALDILEIK